jgi:pimeloyl-ACP methyl ester carboxylesterase
VTATRNAPRFPASRVESGTRIEVGFLGSGPDRSFACLYTPREAPLGGIVICPPLHADFSKNYRNEVLLGRALSRAGCAVLRFHYRGQGHSDGDGSLMSFPSLKEDALEAADHLRSTTGATRLGFVGCRMGGLVAASVAASYEMAPLSLWEPVLSVEGYVQEAIRARLVGDLTAAREERASSAALKEELYRNGSLDVHGYPIHLDLIRSLEGKSLRDELGDGRRPIMLMQIGRSRDVRAEYAALVREWSSLGHPVTVHQVSSEVAWWFRGALQTREQPEALAGEAIARTVDWVGAQLAVTGVSG